MGLLDFNLPGMDTAEGQGLLAASLSLMGATKMPGQKGAFGQALAGAGQQYMQTRGDAQNQMDNREVKRLQIDGLKRRVEQEKQQAMEAARVRELMSSGGDVDYQSLIRQGVPFEMVKQLADSRNLGRDEVARTVETEGPNGTKLVQGFDKWGMPVGQGANGYVAPQLIDQGNRKTFAKPMIGQSFGMGMSPEGADASAARWASHGLAKQRLALDQAGGPEGVKPVKPEWRDGQWVVPPRDMNPGESRPVSSPTKSKDAQEAMGVIAEAEKLIPMSTGSGIGSLVDSTAGFFGASPKGAQAGARLKALEGMLVSKMPKMSGPQSDKDVLLYKQMAGQIGDTSLPVKTRMSALETIKGIQRQYSVGSSGASGGWDSPVKSGGWSIQKAD